VTRARFVFWVAAAAGCASGLPRPQTYFAPEPPTRGEQAGTCTITGPAPADLHAVFVARGASLPIADGYLLSCTCGGRSLQGAAEDRALAGATENRALGGATEDRALAGATENRALGGATEDRALAGATENRALGGATEDRALAGATENRALGGATEDRALAGATEDRALAGATEDRALAGASEQRALAGAASDLTCHLRPDCDGYVIAGHAPLKYYDGQQLVEAVGRCVR
jgi:hypothetical protein